MRRFGRVLLDIAQQTGQGPDKVQVRLAADWLWFFLKIQDWRGNAVGHDYSGGEAEIFRGGVLRVRINSNLCSTILSHLAHCAQPRLFRPPCFDNGFRFVALVSVEFVILYRCYLRVNGFIITI